MDKIVYLSENRIYLKEGDKTIELPSQRILTYLDSLRSIQKRNEWKTKGDGAKFMGMYVKPQTYDQHNIGAAINGLSPYTDGFVYSVNIGETGGMYTKTADVGDTVEGHVIASNHMQIFSIDTNKNQCAASIGDHVVRNLAVFELPKGNHKELTEGDSRDDQPCFSKNGNKIYYSSAGLSMNEHGGVDAVGPYAAMVYDLEAGNLDELYADDGFDYLHIKDDEEGNLYYIKRPYKGNESSNLILDVLMFPVRIVRAIFGLLNFFSIVYGGESLRTKGNSLNTKAKQKSDKEIFIEGNMVNAERTLKKNQQKGEKYPGIIPHSWELMKVGKDGVETCLKKGVLDYALCPNGDILYSNGHAIVRLTESGEEMVEKCRLATNIVYLDGMVM